VWTLSPANIQSSIFNLRCPQFFFSRFHNEFKLTGIIFLWLFSRSTFLSFSSWWALRLTIIAGVILIRIAAHDLYHFSLAFVFFVDMPEPWPRGRALATVQWRLARRLVAVLLAWHSRKTLHGFVKYWVCQSRPLKLVFKITVICWACRLLKILADGKITFVFFSWIWLPNLLGTPAHIQSVKLSALLILSPGVITQNIWVTRHFILKHINNI
jgi:hypothetical protein